MKQNWKFQHIINLEYFLHQDAKSDSQQLHERDRTIFLDSQENLTALEQSTQTIHKNLIWTWLTTRTSTEFGAAGKRSPGAIFTDTLLLAKNISTIKGLIVGLLAGLSFFTYTGNTPVNVFHFLLFFVIPQLVFVAMLIAVYLLHLVTPKLSPPSFYSIFFRGMMTRIIATLNKQWLQTFSAGKRDSVNHALGIVKSRSTTHGSLFYWPVFTLLQLFAIGFNIGLLTVTLLKILASDLAFGWQSTLQLSAEVLYQAVQIIALPWSWFLAQSASFPSLAEIEGSRIILKEGIYHLATQNLVAWWPFLVFCLLFYGLILRASMLILGKIMERKSLAALRLDTPNFISLAQRMQTPLVSTQAEPERTNVKAYNSALPETEQPKQNGASLLSQVVLIPDDIFLLCSTESFTQKLNEKGFGVDKIYPFMADYDADRKLIDILSCRDWQMREGLFIIMEAWMPPLIDFLSYLRELRQVVSENTIINVALIGKPGTTIFIPVTKSDYTVWQNKITAIGDPYLNLFQLVPESNKLS